MSPHPDQLLIIDHLTKRFTSSGYLAIEDVTLDVNRREFVSIVGPSGCGKTTLLKTISGLLHSTSGTVTLAGKLITAPPPELVLVFQDYSSSLFPWLSVEQNVAFPLKYRKIPNGEWKERVNQALAAVHLTGFAGHYPWQLSGGMQQRVAIARALAYHPQILLLDEPFASVDALTRADLEDLLLELREKFGMTMLLVTHDIEESVYLSDRVFVLSSPPALVLREIPVPLTFPRDQITTRSDRQFLELRNEIHGLIGKRSAEPRPVAAAEPAVLAAP